MNYGYFDAKEKEYVITRPIHSCIIRSNSTQYFTR